MTVGQCDSVYHQQLFGLIEENNSLLITSCDKYGSILVATHYIPANGNDTLIGLYRRVDAQAEVVARSRGDSIPRNSLIFI